MDGKIDIFLYTHTGCERGIYPEHSCFRRHGAPTAPSARTFARPVDDFAARFEVPLGVCGLVFLGVWVLSVFYNEVLDWRFFAF